MTDEIDILAIEQTIVDALSVIPWLRLPDDSAVDPDRCRGVADYNTAISFSGIKTPSALVKFDGESPAGTPNATGRIGLPVAHEMLLRWEIYVIGSSFTPYGEGRGVSDILSLPAPPGAYRQIMDVVALLPGLKVDTVSGGRLIYLGCGYAGAEDNRIAYVTRWRHRARRTGTVTS